MLGLFHVRNKSSSLAGWVCRRCYVTRVKGQRGIHPSNRGFARPLVFFVAQPLTEDSRAVVKSMQGKVSIESVQSTFQELRDNNKLHWSIFSTYVPLLLSFKLVDEALQVMREAIMQSMIHPQFYNTFLELLFSRGHIDTAINFLKEVGYTPFPPTIEKWMKRLTYDGKPESIEKALDLAHFLAKETSLTLTDSYTVVYEKIVGLHQAPQWCLSILHEFQNVGEPLPDTFTLPFLHIALVAKPNRDNILHLVQLTSPKIFIDAITWYRDKGDLFLTPLIYKFIEKEFPELIPNFFRTLGYYSFVRLWQLFAQILEPKIDPITKELRIEEDDSVLLSALAVIPQFGSGLLDRMVCKHVTVDAIYYEYKKVRDFPYLKHPFAQSTTPESSSPNHKNGQLTKYPDSEEIFLEYSRAMERHGVRPTQTMNETVIVGFLRERREERAKEVMRWMQGEDLDISGIHTTFADYHVCHKTPESAAKVMLHDMAQDGVHPTLDDFNKVINIMGEHGYLSHAAKLCRDMKGVCGIRPTLTTQTFMMKHTIKHFGLEDGLILLDKIRDKWRLTPTKAIYQILIKAAGEEKRVDKLSEIRGLLRADKIHIDMTLYNDLIEAYLRTGDEVEAKNVLKRFANTGYSPDWGTYRALLRHYAFAKSILNEYEWLFSRWPNSLIAARDKKDAELDRGSLGRNNFNSQTTKQNRETEYNAARSLGREENGTS